jgi:hypothetical protein
MQRLISWGGFEMFLSKSWLRQWKTGSALPLALLCGVLFLCLQGAPVRAEGVSISGRVALSSGEGVANVRVAVGGTTLYALTNSSGEYSIAGVAAGTYNVGPFKDGFIFDPRFRSITVGTTNVTGVNYVAIPAFAIRGRVVNGSGEGVANVHIVRTATSSGFPAAGALTNSSGEYALPPAPAGTYTVTPSLEQTAFDPASRSVTITNAAVTAVNFTASAAYVLRGNVANGEGAAVANVKIVIGPEPPPAPGTTAPSITVFTNADGNYTSPPLRPGSYRLTPMKENAAFDPAFRAVTLTNANIGDLNFRAIPAYAIGGRVATSSGEAIANVTLTLTGGRTVLTNSAGYYLFGGVVPGTYTVTPSKPETVFDPTARSVTVTGASVSGVNFIAVPSASAHTISGRVATSSGTGVAGVKIQRSGSPNIVLTDSNGNYTLPAVQAGTYTVAPSKESLVFDPRSRSVTVGTANVTGVNFVAFAGYTVSGRVAFDGGAGSSGVKVNIAVTSSSGALVVVASALTNGDGNYTLPPVRSGAYTVAPAKEGAAFDPRSRSVTVGTANVTGVNFT